jgi:hypothetical protein
MGKMGGNLGMGKDGYDFTPERSEGMIVMCIICLIGMVETSIISPNHYNM